jgi:hypothetical protein
VAFAVPFATGPAFVALNRVTSSWTVTLPAAAAFASLEPS